MYYNPKFEFVSYIHSIQEATLPVHCTEQNTFFDILLISFCLGTVQSGPRGCKYLRELYFNPQSSNTQVVQNE